MKIALGQEKIPAAPRYQWKKDLSQHKGLSTRWTLDSDVERKIADKLWAFVFA